MKKNYLFLWGYIQFSFPHSFSNGTHQIIYILLVVHLIHILKAHCCLAQFNLLEVVLRIVFTNVDQTLIRYT